MATALVAAVQAAYARVQLQLTFTTVTSATVSRVHADGTVWPVRGANPTLVASTTGVGAVLYDHEAPLDQAITYRAVNGATTVTSNTVTVASDTGNSGSNAWLTHPTNPALSRLVTITSIGGRQRKGRTSILPIVGSSSPVALTDARLDPAGELTAFTTTLADAAAMRTLLADGSVLCLRAPAAWGGMWMYIAVGDATEEAAAGHAADPATDWHLPYTAVAPPAGASAGPVGVTWNDVVASYATWTATLAGEPTWNDVMLKPGP